MQKHFLLLLFLSSFLFSCHKKYIPRQSITVEIINFDKPDTSIRALTVLTDSAMVYAGSKGDITRTKDLGDTWTTQQLKTDSIIPHFRAIGTNSKGFYALSIGNPALLYQSKNATFNLVYKEEHNKVFYNSMAFFDDLNGIAMGDPTADCLSILITRDGGDSWGKVHCKFLPKILPGEAAFAASNTNISIVGDHAWIVTGGSHARVFHSKDKGISWDVYKTPMIQGKSTTGIYTVAFYDEKNGIIMGGDYTKKNEIMPSKAITSDGGETWQIIKQNQPSYTSCVQYIPNTHGKELLATSTEGVYFSNDRGLTWNKVSDQGFYTLRMINQNMAWVAGHEKVALLKLQ
ncbi:MAG: oxidoreductase [Flavobacteriaceae bacterium]|nr:MAG: oxidoreductase [Flavobacteriaceae bacterium]